MIWLPPGLPVIMKGFPSLSTMVGVIELSILFPGATALYSPPVRPNAFGTPGFIEKSSISLLSSIPVPGTVIFDPYLKFSVYVFETALP